MDFTRLGYGRLELILPLLFPEQEQDKHQHPEKVQVMPVNGNPARNHSRIHLIPRSPDYLASPEQKVPETHDADHDV